MFLACGSWCAHLGSSPLFHRCRTVLAFIKSIKPTACRNSVEMSGNLDLQPPSRRHLNTAVFHNHYHNYRDFNRSLKTIRLVVVMSAVELWKPLQPLLSQGDSAEGPGWRIVGIGENALPKPCAIYQTEISPTVLNRISISSPTPIHNGSLREISHGNAIRQSHALQSCDRYFAR